jgi:hypothetical protein
MLIVVSAPACVFRANSSQWLQKRGLYWDRFFRSSVLINKPPFPSKGAMQAPHLGSLGRSAKSRALRPIHVTSGLDRLFAIIAFIFFSLADNVLGTA